MESDLWHAYTKKPYPVFSHFTVRSGEGNITKKKIRLKRVLEHIMLWQFCIPKEFSDQKKISKYIDAESSDL